MVQNNNIKNTFLPNTNIKNKYNQKKGIIISLRDDEYEKNMRITDPAHYYFIIQYNDGSFESYESIDNIEII